MSGSWLFIQLRAYQTQGFQLPFVEGDLVEEGLRGRIPGAGRHPLDERGNRRQLLPGESIGNALRFQIDTGRDRAVWYEVEITSPAEQADFSVAAPDPFQLYTDGSGADLKLGWLRITNAGGASFKPTELLEYQSRGILTSVVRLPASNPTLRSIAPVIRDSAVDTAVAVLNHQSEENVITLRLLDEAGVPQGEAVQVSLATGETKAFFVREKFDIRGDFAGSLELSAPAPFHSLTLRSIANAAGDFALTPYPLETTSSDPLYFAHLTVDGSYSSDILLWNSRRQSRHDTTDGRHHSPAGRCDVTHSPAQSPQDLIDSVIAAYGGREALSRVTSYEMRPLAGRC